MALRVNRGVQHQFAGLVCEVAVWGSVLPGENVHGLDPVVDVVRQGLLLLRLGNIPLIHHVLKNDPPFLLVGCPAGDGVVLGV